MPMHNQLTLLDLHPHLCTDNSFSHFFSYTKILPFTHHSLHHRAHSIPQGMTEEQAVQSHPNLDIYTSSFRAMRNTLSGSPLRCLMKMIVDADSRVVLGAHMVGEHAAEIMQVSYCLPCSLDLGSKAGNHQADREGYSPCVNAP